MGENSDIGRGVTYLGCPDFIYMGKDEQGRILLHGPHAGCTHSITTLPFPALTDTNWHFTNEQPSVN